VLCPPVIATAELYEVADRLRITPAAVGRSIDQLVGQGLVVRREDAEDRRIKRISLTKNGQSPVARHESKHQKLEDFVDRLDPLDRTRLHEALHPILAGDVLRGSSEEFRQ